MTIPKTLPRQIADLYYRIAEIDRRARNRKRKGTVAEIGSGENAGKYKVKLSEPGGKPYVTGWLKSRVLGGGATKIDIMRKVGEQVDVVSESGDITDAEIDLSTYSDDNARENGSDIPLHIKIGDAVLSMSGDSVTIKAGTITLDGVVHLGGEGGQLLHRKGDLDSGGDSAVGSATRVYAV